MRRLLFAMAPLVSALAVSALTASAASTLVAAPSGPAAWIGSPIVGTVSSTPAAHHTTYGGQWSVDIAGSGTAVLYLAKSYAEDRFISARIVQVGYACGRIPWDSQNGNSDARRLLRGGKKVVVDVRYEDTWIGRITFAHLDTSLAIGSYPRTGSRAKAINRWGGVLGTVGSYQKVKKPDGSYCWGGKHVHVEPANLNGGLSCYWSALNTYGQKRGAPDKLYLGYVGYKSSRLACPNGI